MATGWSITIGYNSSHSPVEKEDLWEILKNSAQIWRINASTLRDEAERYGAPLELDGENLMDFCEVYRRDWLMGGPLHIDDDKQALYIDASGGGASRVLKEHVARAFCRLVVIDMHHKCIEVNLHVS